MQPAAPRCPLHARVIEALRDEPDQDLLARRLASEVALSSVLEKALLLQRTLLTGKKEPNVAANQLAVEAVNHESDTLDQEIRNLKTELELRRELANNSPMAIIQRHGTRGPARGIYEGDPVPDRLDRLQRATREARHERGLAAPALAFQPARGKTLLLAVVIIAAAVGANLVGIYLVGSVAGWERWLAASAGYFLVWRLCLYGATVYGWSGCAAGCWPGEEDAQARRRLVRSEIAGVVAIVALEASLLMQS